jgi:phage gpG-like protein
MAVVRLKMFSQKAERKIRRTQTNLRDLRPLWREVHKILHDSTMRNFDEGGRRPKWKKRTRNYAHPILQKTRRLRKSISKRFEGGFPLLRTQVHYAPYHQLGAPKANLPQRKFFVIRREDRAAVKKAVERHVGKGVV